jgi:hypothetical protein
MVIEIPMLAGLALRIGEDGPGRNKYPTARLQSGFLLVDNGEELAEEAVGFGVPVLQKGLQTIFPGAVQLSQSHDGPAWRVTALFTLNLVEKISRDGEKDLENRLLYAGKNIAAAVIRDLPGLRGLLTGSSNLLRHVFRLETTYAQTSSSAALSMVYTLNEKTGKIGVEVDTSGLASEFNSVMIMNEQGAHHFDRYQDCSGNSILGAEIGCWDEVSAQQARFESSRRKVAFGMEQVPGARLFRGRELVGSRLAWAGFGYSFSPAIKKFHYEMSIARF